MANLLLLPPAPAAFEVARAGSPWSQAAVLCGEEKLGLFPCERCDKRTGNLRSGYGALLSKLGFAGLVLSAASRESHPSLALQREREKSFALFVSGFGCVYDPKDQIVPDPVLNIVPACHLNKVSVVQDVHKVGICTSGNKFKHAAPK